MQRRTFLSAPLFGTLSGAFVPSTHASTILETMALDMPAKNQSVQAVGDGIDLSPSEYASLLGRLAPEIEPDEYSRGGVVAELERSVAKELGKETAMWVSTGTLANHLALRVLAGNKRRVIVQKESHIYNDSGDCCEALSGLNLLPLAENNATYTLEDLKREFDRSLSSRVDASIGALMIESPVRRRSGETFDFSEMRSITGWARERNIGLHLDGARLYIASAYSGISVREYAALFDTVYISMYKYFNAASGAILAGPRRLLDGLFNARRMFGNGLCHVWPFAAIARHYFDGFTERFAQSIAISEKVITALRSDPRFEVHHVPHGTNIFYLRLRQGDPLALQRRAKAAGLILRSPDQQRFEVHVNETWMRATAQEIVSCLA